MSMQIAQTRAPQSPARRIAILGLSLALGSAVVLAAALIGGQWLFDPQGRPIANDFVNVWAAGRLTLDGHPALAYDWVVHKSMEVRAVGHAFDNYYGWHYPPLFLFVAAPLALLPFTASALIWLVATGTAFAALMRGILREPAGLLVALGFPAALWNVMAGQNGFLTATLIGCTLMLLEKRPLLAGICLGLLAYKPQFGLLFPVALIAAGYWRVLGAAAVTTIVLLAASWLAFGTDTWAAFFTSMPKLTESVLVQGLAGFERLQSVFGFVRSHGGSELQAWMAQGVITVASAVTVFALWRSRAAFELKAAGLVALTLAATPYVYIYDLVILAVALGFMLRYVMARGMIVIDAVVFIAVIGLLLTYPFVQSQVGLAASLLMASLCGWRAATRPAFPRTT